MKTIKQLTEEFDAYEDVQPTLRQKEIAENLFERFKKIISELGTKNDVSIDERTCLAKDLGEDYPEVRVLVQTEDKEDFFFVSYIFPVGAEEDVAKNLESCPLSVSLVSDVFGLDELYPIEDNVDAALDKLENKIRTELNLIGE